MHNGGWRPARHSPLHPAQQVQRRPEQDLRHSGAAQGVPLAPQQTVAARVASRAFAARSAHENMTAWTIAGLTAISKHATNACVSCCPARETGELLTLADRTACLSAAFPNENSPMSLSRQKPMKRLTVSWARACNRFDPADSILACIAMTLPCMSSVLQAFNISRLQAAAKCYMQMLTH